MGLRMGLCLTCQSLEISIRGQDQDLIWPTDLLFVGEAVIQDRAAASAVIQAALDKLFTMHRKVGGVIVLLVVSFPFLTYRVTAAPLHLHNQSIIYNH